MIYANLATIQEREHLLKKVVFSIVTQVDKMYISLNDYNEIPEWLSHNPKIIPILRENQKGDGEKFLNVENQNGYIFTIDDDLQFPSGYIETMISHIERFNRKCIISLHGRTFRRIPIVSYYRGKLTGYHWDVNQNFDIEVGAGGTGVMCWHSDTIKVKYEDIKRANCADVWMSVFARRAGVKIMCVKHKEGWVKYIGPKEDLDNPKTIWSSHINSIEHNRAITEIYNDGKTI